MYAIDQYFLPLYREEKQWAGPTPSLDWPVKGTGCQYRLWRQNCGPFEDLVLSSTSRKTCIQAAVLAHQLLTFFFPLQGAPCGLHCGKLKSC